MSPLRKKKLIKNFLADTWWYGLTNRWSKKELVSLVRLRKKQGFSAVQIVVGIPPEIGPNHPSASSEVGPAWDLSGNINHPYLKLAKEKIKLINKLGLKVIVYGAWGQQIEWIGETKIKEWWKELISLFDKLNVIFCLTGESDIWIGQEKLLIPDKSTDDLCKIALYHLVPKKIKSILLRALNRIFILIHKNKLKIRQKKWSNVLAYINDQTVNPIIIHPVQKEFSFETVTNPELLSAITVQTGHESSSKVLLWQYPKKLRKIYPKVPYINLEPWYEGIRNQFYEEDQLYSFWVTMLSGAAAYCYGAHGIWNIGDGRFLSHWGKQSFKEAVGLKTPELIGKSYKLFINFLKKEGVKNYICHTTNENLDEIGILTSSGKSIIYYPDCNKIMDIKKGRYWDPLSAKFVRKPFTKKQLVVFSN